VVPCWLRSAEGPDCPVLATRDWEDWRLPPLPLSDPRAVDVGEDPVLVVLLGLDVMSLMRVLLHAL
jgi:hypothetical protein